MLLFIMNNLYLLILIFMFCHHFGLKIVYEINEII